MFLDSVLTQLGETSLLGWATAVSSLIATYVSGVVVYRLYFHPLSKFPGPFWAKISGFPAYYHTQNKNRHVWLWTLQEKYGSTFRYTPDSILINTPTGFKQIFNPKANIGKSEYYKVYPRSPEAVTTWNTTSSAVHTRKRRVLNNAFSDKALRNAEPYVHQNIDRWCDLLEEEIDKNGGQWSGSLNMAHWANHLIFDILGSLCFGKSFGMKEHDSQLRFVPDLMADFLAIIHPIAFSPFVSFWVWLKPRGLDSLLASTAPPALADWAGFVSKCFEERAQIEEELKKNPKPESETRKDFFHYLFGAVDPETGKPGYNMSELFGESESLIIAGSDTTAIATAAAVFYLVRNPDIQTKLAAEVRAAFETTDDIKAGTKLQSDCRYLQAFIKEVLRASPPTPAEMSREVLPGGAVINDHYLPAGVKVSSASYCMHHNTELYDKPFEFRPERWLADAEGSTAESVALAESGYCPFSAGPRSCVGKNLAYMEMSVVVAKLMHRFEIRQDAESKNLGGGSPDLVEGRRCAEQYQLYEIFVAVRDGPMVQFKKRA